MKAIAMSTFVLMLALAVNGQEPSLVVTNATVINPRSGDRLQGRTIVVTGSRITAVDAASYTRVPQGATVIDGTGRFVMPGLIDTHIHLGFEIYAQEGIEAGVKGVMHVAGIPLVKPEDRPAPPTTARFGPDSWTDWWLYYTKLWLRVDAALEQRLIETMVKQQAWLEPTLITEDWIANAQSYRDTWADRGLPGALEQAHEGSPLYSGRSLEEFRAAFHRMKDFVRRFRRAGGVVVAGTDCILGGCSYGLADELRLLVRLRVLDEDPLRDVRNVTTPRAVVINGRHLDRSQLDALRASP
jgi:imidazolonepropionase-like amidohydrolase